MINADRSALIYGPENPNARFWAIRATSRRNRSLNRVSKKLEKPECARNKKTNERQIL